MTGTDRRRAILKAAEDCVCRDRQAAYSDAEDNFANIALVYNAIFGHMLKPGVSFRAHHVAMANSAQKLCRLSTSPGHLDNWVDLAGYAACGGGIAKLVMEGDDPQTSADPDPQP